jgi:RNA polymerase sigma-70 factor, ECF subfamily
MNQTGVATTMLLASETEYEEPGAARAIPASPCFASTGIEEDQTTRPASEAEFPHRIENEIPFLRRAVRRWHREKPDADDLVQNTLVQALANAHLWQPGTNLRAWLSTIMRNEFLAAVARSSRYASAVQAIAAADPAPAADTPEVRLILRDVASALGRLPKKQRSALFLVSVEGQSYEEVAMKLGRSVGAVRCDVARARDRLRAAVHKVDERSPLARPATRAPSAAASRQLRRIPPALALAGGD